MTMKHEKDMSDVTARSLVHDDVDKDAGDHNGDWYDESVENDEKGMIT